MPIAIAIGRENRIIKRTVRGVVHSEHNRHHARFISKDIPIQPRINPPAAARDTIPTPAGVREIDLQMRKARHHIGLGERGIESLIGDAVSVEHNMITVLELDAADRHGFIPCRRLSVVFEFSNRPKQAARDQIQINRIFHRRILMP